MKGKNENSLTNRSKMRANKTIKKNLKREERESVIYEQTSAQAIQWKKWHMQAYEARGIYIGNEKGRMRYPKILPLAERFSDAY